MKSVCWLSSLTQVVLRDFSNLSVAVRTIVDKGSTKNWVKPATTDNNSTVVADTSPNTDETWVGVMPCAGIQDAQGFQSFPFWLTWLCLRNFRKYSFENWEQVSVRLAFFVWEILIGSRVSGLQTNNGLNGSQMGFLLKVPENVLKFYIVANNNVGNSIFMKVKSKYHVELPCVHLWFGMMRRIWMVDVSMHSCNSATTSPAQELFCWCIQLKCKDTSGPLQFPQTDWTACICIQQNHCACKYMFFNNYFRPSSLQGMTPLKQKPHIVLFSV